MHKIVLLGGTGLLGQAVSSNINSDSNVEAYVPSHSELDVTNEDLLRNYLSDIRPDIVINCTGYNEVDNAEENVSVNYEMNCEVPRSLAEMSNDLGFKLVQFSTDYIFDGENKDGYLENAEANPLNKYGEAKAEAEKDIQEIAEKYFIIRISWLFGPGKKNFVTTMLQLADEKDELTIVDDQFGKPTYTLDVAARLKDFFDSEDYGIYHLPNEGVTSWYDFAYDIFALHGGCININAVSSSQFKKPAERPSNSVLINAKLAPLRSHKEALKHYFENYLS